jgi:hypothetical protein
MTRGPANPMAARSLNPIVIWHHQRKEKIKVENGEVIRFPLPTVLVGQSAHKITTAKPDAVCPATTYTRHFPIIIIIVVVACLTIVLASSCHIPALSARSIPDDPSCDSPSLVFSPPAEDAHSADKTCLNRRDTETRYIYIHTHISPAKNPPIKKYIYGGSGNHVSTGHPVLEDRVVSREPWGLPRIPKQPFTSFNHFLLLLSSTACNRLSA